MESFARDAAWRGVEVLWGHCNESGRMMPFEVIVDALSSGLTSLRVKQLAYALEEIWLSVLATVMPKLRTELPALPIPQAMASEQAYERLSSAFTKLPHVPVTTQGHVQQFLMSLR